jgi:uncharacterized protein (DUF1810 family)
MGFAPSLKLESNQSFYGENIMEDQYDLQRFVAAQMSVFDVVCDELREGRKRSHWMWFVFPQISGLGHSATARKYAISSLDEARAYLQHPVLGDRLRRCCELVGAVQGRTAEGIFGPTDAMKFRSSMTLFMHAAPDDRIFSDCLKQFFDGKPDAATLALL